MLSVWLFCIKPKPPDSPTVSTNIQRTSGSSLAGMTLGLQTDKGDDIEFSRDSTHSSPEYFKALDFYRGTLS